MSFPLCPNATHGRLKSRNHFPKESSQVKSLRMQRSRNSETPPILSRYLPAIYRLQDELIRVWHIAFKQIRWSVHRIAFRMLMRWFRLDFKDRIKYIFWNISWMFHIWTNYTVWWLVGKRFLHLWESQPCHRSWIHCAAEVPLYFYYQSDTE